MWAIILRKRFIVGSRQVVHPMVIQLICILVILLERIDRGYKATLLPQNIRHKCPYTKREFNSKLKKKIENIIIMFLIVTLFH